MITRRVLCRLIGHDRRRVTAAPGESRRYYSHPRGERVGCHRCRRVLPEGS